MKPSAPETEAQIEKLVETFGAMKDGDTVEWSEVEALSGVPMGQRGRKLARRALKKLGRPYEALVGEGVRLSSPTTAMTIVRGKFSRISGAVRVAERTQRHLQARHLEQMSPDDQRRMLITAGFFGAVKAFAMEARTKILKT